MSQDPSDFDRPATSEPEGRVSLTLLVCDVQNCTGFFERRGDETGVLMLRRVTEMVRSAIEKYDGRIVRQMKDTFLARFADSERAVRAGTVIQQRMADDRRRRDEDDQVHLRIGIHAGPVILFNDDVFGDAVNAATKIERIAAADQVVVSEIVAQAAREAQFALTRLEPIELKNKEEPIALYAVAWSEETGSHMLEEIQERYERRLREARQLFQHAEEELDIARDAWRKDKRRLSQEIERLEDELRASRVAGQARANQDLAAQLRSEVEAITQQKIQIERELTTATGEWERQRDNLREQVATVQAAMVDAISRANNPVRNAILIREQVQARLDEARMDWGRQWDAERRRLQAEIERLMQAIASAESKDGARKAIMERLGRATPSSAPADPLANNPQAQKLVQEIERLKLDADLERAQLQAEILRLQREAQLNLEGLRNEIRHELMSTHEVRLAESEQLRKKLEEEVGQLTHELQSERTQLQSRVRLLEEALKTREQAVRTQVTSELSEQFELRAEEAVRLKSRAERALEDLREEFESEKRRARKQIEQLETALRDCKEQLFKFQKNTGTP